MVAGAFPILEWPEFLPYTDVGSPTRFPGFIRCSRILGLWGVLSGPLVLWSPLWITKWVEFLCDNEAVMAVLKSGTSKDPNLTVLLHYLSLSAVHHSFSFTSSSV